jgi:hypothetical protein
MTKPLGCNEGFLGEVTLCLDVPEEELQRFDVTDELQEASGYRLALLPAELLNRIGKPQMYDHLFAGVSRRDMLRNIRQAEGRGDDPSGQMLRQAFEFFDRIGWLTPLKLREQEESAS